MWWRELYILVCVSVAIRAECPKDAIIEKGFSINEQQNIVDLHNFFRSKNAQGTVPFQPKASNMLQMTWDESLAAQAQRMAESCEMKHRPVIDNRFPVGQNLFTSWSDDKETGPQWPRAVKSWYDEVKTYKYNKKTYNHYTQLMWAVSHKVGCGYVSFTEREGLRKLYVCLYGPSGNKKGVAPYNVGEGCDYLCDKTEKPTRKTQSDQFGEFDGMSGPIEPTSIFKNYGNMPQLTMGPMPPSAFTEMKSVPSSQPDWLSQLFPQQQFYTQKQQSMEQPIGQSMGQSMSQPMGQPMGQPMEEPMGQPMGEPMGHSIDQSMRQPMGQSLGQPVGHPMGQSMSQPMGELMGQSLRQSVGYAMGQPKRQPMGEPMGQSIGQPMTQLMGQPMEQSIELPVGEPMGQSMGQLMRQPMVHLIRKPGENTDFFENLGNLFEPQQQPPMYQSIQQPMKQPFNQPMGGPMQNHMHQTMRKPKGKPAETTDFFDSLGYLFEPQQQPPMYHSMQQPMKQPINQPMGRPMQKHMHQTMEHPIGKPVKTTDFFESLGNLFKPQKPHPMHPSMQHQMHQSMQQPMRQPIYHPMGAPMQNHMHHTMEEPMGKPAETTDFFETHGNLFEPQKQIPMHQLMEQPKRHPIYQLMGEPMQNHMHQTMKQPMGKPAPTPDFFESLGSLFESNKKSPMHQSVQQPIRQPLNQPMGGPMQNKWYHSMGQPMQQFMEQPVQQQWGQPMQQPVEHPIHQFMEKPNNMQRRMNNEENVSSKALEAAFVSLNDMLNTQSKSSQQSTQRRSNQHSLEKQHGEYNKDNDSTKLVENGIDLLVNLFNSQAKSQPTKEVQKQARIFKREINDDDSTNGFELPMDTGRRSRGFMPQTPAGNDMMQPMQKYGAYPMQPVNMPYGYPMEQQPMQSQEVGHKSKFFTRVRKVWHHIKDMFKTGMALINNFIDKHRAKHAFDDDTLSYYERKARVNQYVPYAQADHMRQYYPDVSHARKLDKMYYNYGYFPKDKK